MNSNGGRKLPKETIHVPTFLEMIESFKTTNVGESHAKRKGKASPEHHEQSGEQTDFLTAYYDV